MIYNTIFTNVTLGCLGVDNMYIFGEGLLCYTVIDIHVHVIYCI